MTNNLGVQSIGVKLPIIRQGDDIVRMIYDSVINNVPIDNGDIIGITESVIARAEGNYVTVEDIKQSVLNIFGPSDIITVIAPIYSRNRFSVILKGISMATKRIHLVMPPTDEVGNPRVYNPYTKVNIQDYYQKICQCDIVFYCVDKLEDMNIDNLVNPIVCKLHCDYNYYANKGISTLVDICHDKCDYGVLGSNRVDDNTLKLFPTLASCEAVINGVKSTFSLYANKDIEVMVYADGCYKDPDVGIWEFADPVAAPAYTEGLRGCPSEIKLKAFADDKFANLKGEELAQAIKDEIREKDIRKEENVGAIASQGTTPRRYVNLLASLMDLTSGSGDRGTPVVVVKNYFKNYATE